MAAQWEAQSQEGKVTTSSDLAQLNAIASKVEWCPDCHGEMTLDKNRRIIECEECGAAAYIAFGEVCFESGDC